MSGHDLLLYSPNGDFIGGLSEYKSIDCTLAENNDGDLTIALFPVYSDQMFQRDCRIVYQRAPPNRTPKVVGDTTWILTRRERRLESDGQHTILLNCAHPNSLLRRRVVAYDEGTAQAKKTVTAGDDILKAIIRENFTAATDTSRNIASTQFVVDPDTAGATNTSIECSYRTVFDVAQEIVKAVAANGVYMGFEVVTPTVPGPFRFRTYVDQRGTDRGLGTTQQVILDGLNYSATEVEVTEDWTDAVSFVYAGGAGKGTERPTNTAYDSELIGQSSFGRYEYFQTVGSTDTNVIGAAANKALRQFRPVRALSATLDPVYAQQIYDVDFTWGDIVGALFSAPVYAQGGTLSWIEFQFNCRIDPVRITVQRFFDEQFNLLGEDETVEIHLRSTSSIGQG